jgi:hypothetical protein
MEAADKRPDATVMILAGSIESLVSRPPIGMMGQDIWEIAIGAVRQHQIVASSSQ